MKKLIISNIVTLLLIVAVAVYTVWLLPVRVLLVVLLLLQVATFVILGDLIKRNGHGKEE